MKILVCVKQVPALDVAIELDQQKQWLSNDTDVEYRINRFDEFAIEEALQIKSEFPESLVHAISVGPDRAATAIQRAMGMGADHGIHIQYAEEGFVDPHRVSNMIGQYARGKDYDLILTGIMAEDTMQCMVGPLVAADLNIPCAVSAIKTSFHQTPENDLERSIFVTSELEGGIRQGIQLKLPALISVQSGINQPRYPSLSNILRAKKHSIECFEPSPPDVPGCELLELALPPKTAKTVFIQGTLEQKAHTLLKILNKNSVLK